MIVNMEKEKRMVGTYEIKLAIHIGDKEIVYGEDTKPKSSTPYMVATHTINELFEQYDNAEGSKDYLEIMYKFISRVENQIDMLKEARQQVDVFMEPITDELCYPNDPEKSIENKVVALKASSLRPEYRSADYQMVMAICGFGTQGKSRGRAVFTKNLYYGFEERWNREDIQGVVKEELLPEWTKEKLQQMQTQNEEHIVEPDLTM